jgi:hypothetical protein
VRSVLQKLNNFIIKCVFAMYLELSATQNDASYGAP